MCVLRIGGGQGGWHWRVSLHLRRQERFKIDQRDHRFFDGDEARQEAGARVVRHFRHRLDLRRIDRDDVEHAVGQEPHRFAIDLDHDDDVHRRGVGQAVAEPATQIDDRHDHAAQIEDAAHAVGLFGQLGDGRPVFDLAHRHDVDAVLLVANGKTDELGCSRRCAGVLVVSPITQIRCGYFTVSCNCRRHDIHIRY